jgi:hypothetical protein
LRRYEEKFNERKLGEQSIGALITYRPPQSFHKQFVLLKSPRGDWNFVKGHKESLRKLVLPALTYSITWVK